MVDEEPRCPVCGTRMAKQSRADVDGEPPPVRWFAYCQKPFCTEIRKMRPLDDS